MDLSNLTEKDFIIPPCQEFYNYLRRKTKHSRLLFVYRRFQYFAENNISYWSRLDILNQCYFEGISPKTKITKKETIFDLGLAQEILIAESYLK